MKNARRTIVGLAALLGLVLPVVSAGAPVSPLMPVTVSEARTANNAPFYIALEEGYFAAEGLDIKIGPFLAVPLVIPALMSGELDLTLNAPSVNLMQAVAKGASVRIVADKGHAGPGDRSQVLMVRQDLIDAGRFRTLRDLRGLKIAESSKGTQPEFMITQVLRNRAFLTEKDVVRVPIVYTLAPAALLAKSVDAAIIPEPSVTMLERLHAAKAILTLQDVLPRSQVGTIIYGTNLLGRRREVGQRFLNAYLRGVRQYHKGKTARNTAIIAKYTGQEVPTIRLMTWAQVYEDGHVNVESLLQLQAWWLREGLQDVALTPDQFLDMSFAKAAYQALGPGR